LVTTHLRYSRRTRWFHTLVYLASLALFGTGWWLVAGREGQPSYLAKLFTVPDVTLHKDIGWALAALGALAIVVGWRGTITFLRESFTYRASDARWLARWPLSVFTGHFSRHDGHFDPGQRIANVVIAGGLLTLVVTGIGLVRVHGGSSFVWFLRIHEWTTFVLTPVIAGHILIALGVLPGYRGVWRSMHFGGRVSHTTARRLWPAWVEQHPTAGSDVTGESSATESPAPPRTG
jgi:formate dehydrogenase subunit gamma